MNNYLLSVDPSMKNTGFTLGEKTKRISECEVDYREIEYIYKGKPIGIESYDFKKYNTKYEVSKSDAIYNNNFNFLIKGEIEKLIKCDIGSLFYNNNLNLIIERGTFHSKNGIGYETQEHLRGFIAGQFNKLLTKDMLISPSEGKKGYEHYDPPIFGLRPGDKELSIYVAEEIIKENKGDIKVNNHDQAESLLIGGYYINKENK